MLLLVAPAAPQQPVTVQTVEIPVEEPIRLQHALDAEPARDAHARRRRPRTRPSSYAGEPLTQCWGRSPRLLRTVARELQLPAPRRRSRARGCRGDQGPRASGRSRGGAGCDDGIGGGTCGGGRTGRPVPAAERRARDTRHDDGRHAARYGARTRHRKARDADGRRRRPGIRAGSAVARGTAARRCAGDDGAAGTLTRDRCRIGPGPGVFSRGSLPRPRHRSRRPSPSRRRRSRRRRWTWRTSTALVQAMRVTAKAGGWEATVRLKPEHLGEVTIALARGWKERISRRAGRVCRRSPVADGAGRCRPFRPVGTGPAARAVRREQGWATA